VAYPWHPLHGQRVRVYGRQGRAGRQILYIEVQPGLSREIPAWMCDAAVCAAISSGGPRLAIAALSELRAVFDGRSAGRPSDGSSTSSMAKEGLDETSLSQSTDARSQSWRKKPVTGNGAGGIAVSAGRSASRSSRQATVTLAAGCVLALAAIAHIIRWSQPLARRRAGRRGRSRTGRVGARALFHHGRPRASLAQ
jgi:hypothetical protein